MAMALTKTRILSQLTPHYLLPCVNITAKKFHESSTRNAYAAGDNEPKKFLSYNKEIYPPQSPDEEPRPGFVCHQRCNIKYSPWKMWYVASFVRGMSVDEAIKQLKFNRLKGAQHAREVIEEARELAVKEHNIEFASNLWVAESFVGKGQVIKGIRRHARGRFGIVEYFHCHYFVRLEEGKPPKHYYHNYQKPPSEQLSEWLEQMRRRKIVNSL